MNRPLSIDQSGLQVIRTFYSGIRSRCDMLTGHMNNACIWNNNMNERKHETATITNIYRFPMLYSLGTIDSKLENQLQSF